MTTVYLLRHSKPLQVNNELNSDNLQVQNEKRCLSVEGEKFAKEKLSNKELKSIDVLYASNYVRAIGTAKYIAENNNIDINIISDLGERKYGVKSWDEKPKDFERKQFLDENYKIGNGESRKEVSKRMYKAIMDIVSNNKDKTIAIVSHATAISYFLKNWCDIQIVDDKLKYSFNDKVFLNGPLNYCETFKLVFDGDKILDIQNIK